MTQFLGALWIFVGLVTLGAILYAVMERHDE